MSDFTDLITPVIANPGTVVARDPGESVSQWAARAVEATLDAAEKKFIDDQVAQANILGWNRNAGVTDLQVSMALETAAALVSAAKTFLTAVGAENYVEQHVHDRETGERYTLTIQRPGAKTPHELRRQAEQDRDMAIAALLGDTDPQARARVAAALAEFRELNRKITGAGWQHDVEEAAWKLATTLDESGIEFTPLPPTPHRSSKEFSRE